MRRLKVSGIPSVVGADLAGRLSIFHQRRRFASIGCGGSQTPVRRSRLRVTVV